MKTPLVRAVHLIGYLGVLREIGAPVDRYLADAGLPGQAEEFPDNHLCVPRVLDCVARSSRDANVTELGYIAARRSSLSSLSPPFRQALVAAPNGLHRVRTMLIYDRHEDGALRSAIVPEKGNLRLICNIDTGLGSPALPYAEWLQLHCMVDIVRSVAGQGWIPREMTFVSRETCSHAARAAFGNTRMRFGQRNTSILVPRDLLARPRMDSEPDPYPPMPGEPQESLVSYLKRAIRPYLAGSAPSLPFVANLVGVSGRTLQRELATLGRSYSGILAETRYEIASDMLGNTSAKVIEIAYQAGYEHPEHFSRAFRRFSGISPRDYRKSILRDREARGS